VAVIAGGVLWSNFLGYGGINLGPRERFVELEEVGERFAGDGPALMTEYEPFGVRHFLGPVDPEGASELRRRQVPLRDGQLLGKAETADIDEFDLGAVLTYRTLVLRRSATSSRPPSPYRLVARGRWYEVWQRPAGAADCRRAPPAGRALRPRGGAALQRGRPPGRGGRRGRPAGRGPPAPADDGRSLARSGPARHLGRLDDAGGRGSARRRHPEDAGGAGGAHELGWGAAFAARSR
jgi:hypothetical protein